MSAAAKLTGFAAVLAAIFVIAMLAGNAVGPVHSTQPTSEPVHGSGAAVSGMTTSMRESSR